MNIKRRLERDQKIAKFLCTPVTYYPDGRPVYPNTTTAAIEFDLSVPQICRIKKRLVEVKGPERHMING